MFWKLGKDKQPVQNQEDETPDYYSDDDDGDEDIQAKKKKCWETVAPKLRELLGLKEKSEEVLPDDYNRNPDYHPSFWYLRPYLLLSMQTHHLVVKNEYFNYFILWIIIAAGIMVAVDQYPEIAETFGVYVFETAILGVFCFEMLAKIVMEGLIPWNYFIGKEWKWNCFDFIIVFLSLPLGLFKGTSAVKLLRLVRLARLGKLIRKIPALQMIISGLAGGLSSISYIMLLLILVFYLYGVLGFYLFSVNDPYHFGSLPLAMLTLFRVTLYDNWGDIIFQNLYGCVLYPDMYVSDNMRTPENSLLWCRNPHRVPPQWMTVIYFITFVVIAGFVMLSLFIGAVTLSMNESMAELKKLAEEKKKKAAFEENKKKIQGLRSTKQPSTPGGLLGGRDSPANRPESPGSIESQNGRRQTVFLVQQDGTGIGSNNDNTREDDDEEEDDNEDGGESIFSKIASYLRPVPFFYPLFYVYDALCELLEAIAVEDEAERERFIAESLRVAMGWEEMEQNLEALHKDEPVKEQPHTMSTKRVGELLSQKLVGSPEANHMSFLHLLLLLYLKLGKVCNAIVTHAFFVNFVTGVILAAGANIGMQEELAPAVNPALEELDKAILSVFTIECVLKLIAEGNRPWRYFNSSWNCFDLLIVVGCWAIPGGGLITVVRLLRLLRVLKLVKRLPQLAVIVDALVNAIGSIGYIGLILFLFIYVFAILGMLLFQTADPWHFGTFHGSMIMLFRVITLDNWAHVLYTTMYGCDIGGYGDVYAIYPNQCKDTTRYGAIAAAFYVFFTIIGAQVLLSLFIGVISTSMEESRQLKKEETTIEIDLKKLGIRMGMKQERLEAFKRVFALLDLDNGGTIEEEELEIGLQAINQPLPKEEMMRLLDHKDVDPRREGVNVCQFIVFMSLLPMFKKSITSMITTWKKDTKKKKPPFYQPAFDFFLGGEHGKSAALEVQAAITLQVLWRNKRQREAAKREVEDRKKRHAERLRLKMEEEGAADSSSPVSNQDKVVGKQG